MSNIMETIKSKAVKLNRHVVLPESDDERTVRAAGIIASENIAKITLLGDNEKLKAKYPDMDFSKIKIINPKTSEKHNEYSQLLYNLRKEKGMTIEEANELTLNPLYYGCLMLKTDEADGLVAGAQNTTGDVLRPALQIVKTAPGIKTCSSCFIMAMPKDGPGIQYGENGILIFADCAVVPNPTAEQLADIAVSSAKTAKALAGITDPKVAMLSFSTNGSAKDDLVDKVRQAVEILNGKNVDFVFDGEMQADTAIVEKVSATKFPGSKIKGKANVLVFPDLQSGNIGYKLVQRLAGAEAIGPILQGFNKPINDLSRGCSVDDIVNVVAIAAVSSV